MPQVSEYPFAEVLREFQLNCSSGAVRFERKRGRAVVYFESGQPVFAASNIKELRLGTYLIKRELLTPEQLAPMRRLSDTSLVTELIRQKLMGTRAISQASAGVVNDILRMLLLWTDGSWEYDERARLADSFTTTIDTATLLLTTVRKMEPSFVATRLADPEEIITPAPDSSMLNALSTIEGFVLSRLDQPMRLRELVLLSGQAEGVALRIIYGLALAGCVQRESWPSALKTKPPKPRKPVIAPPTDTEKADLQRFFDRIEGSESYYQVLDTAAHASLDEIKQAYYGLARRYHPDRFHGNVQVHARVESAFARITQAYETLVDPTQRGQYDARLAARERIKATTEATTQKPAITYEASVKPEASPEMNFQEGFAALKIGQVNQAIPHLAVAAQTCPHEARYRAYYGRALALSGKAQRTAEMELQEAIRLEPNNPAYHFMLAQLYYELKFIKRARAEAIRALELDPKYAEAQALIRKLPEK
jgi:curved DNA-binding protein CbpA